MGFKFQYKELQELEKAIEKKCDSQLDTLSDIKSSTKAFINADNISGANADAIKSYLSIMYRTAISAMQLIMQTYGKEYKRYIKNYPSNKMGGTTSIEQDELTEARTNLNSTKQDFYAVASQVNATIKFANQNLESHSLSSIHYSELANARNDTIKIIDETEKTVLEIEGQNQDGLKQIRLLITDLDQLLDGRTSHNVNIDSLNPETLWDKELLTSVKKRTLDLWVYDYMKTKDDNESVSDNEYNEYELLEDLIAGQGDGEMLIELAMAYDGTTSGAQFWNELANELGHPEIGQYNGQPYCACFVSWAAAKMGLLDKEIPFFTYVPDGVDWFQERGQYHSKNSGYIPKPGDIVFYGESDHVGYVVKYDPKTNTIFTIEGNTSSNGSQSNGGCVAYKQRDLSWVMGYGSVKYPMKKGNSPFELSKSDIKSIQKDAKTFTTRSSSKIDLNTPKREDTVPSITKKTSKTVEKTVEPKSTQKTTESKSVKSTQKTTENKSVKSTQKTTEQNTKTTEQKTKTTEQKTTETKQTTKEATKSVTKEFSKQTEKVTEQVKNESQKLKEQASQTKDTIKYTVKKGDTLWEIGQEYGVDYHDIAKDNDIKDPSLIHPGETFTINQN